MKLLFDDNLSYRLVREFAADFAGSAHVRSCGLRGADDRSIWQYAKSNGFAIVTLDADYYDISLLRGWPPKIVWLRAFDTSTHNLRRILRENADRIDRFLAEDAYACLEIVDRK